jgi:type I restriction enzyme S subunit
LGIEATTNQAVCHIIPNKGTADVRYLFYALQSKVDYWLNKRVGGGQPNISQGVIKDTVLHLPPLAEQKRIAEILDAADALRAKRREALTQLDALLQATFLDLFGDPVTNPKGWVLKTLEESGAKTKVGPFGSLLHVADYICDGIPLVNPKHMVEGQIVHGGDETVSEEKASELEDYRLKVGDLLVARRGEMGRCVIVRPEHSGWLCGTGSFYIRAHADAFLPEYLAACLSNQSMRRFLEHLSGGAIMPSLSGTQIKNLRISLPPMNEQVKFVRICQSISEHQSQQSAHLAELDVLFASLQSRAFRGEL